MDITLKIILFFLGGIAYFLATRASKVEHALLPAVRAFGFTCVLLAFSETIGETPFYLRTFAILLLATVGIVRSAAVLAMQHRSGYRAGKKAAALLATQIALGIAVIIGATVAAGDGAQAQISSQQNLFSSLILIVVILFIAISAILFFRPARDFSKLSAPEFAVTIVNLVALGMLVGPQVNILAIAGIFLVAYLFTFGKRNTPQPASIPLERKKIIDIMRLGWMILDEKNNILDVNPFIEVITGQSSAVLRGKSAHDILTNDEMLAQENQMSEYSVLARVDFDGFVYSFDVRSIPLLKENGDLGGRLLLWQDVTEQKKMEESRQRALETRINLMRSISTAANHITDINIFLEAAIFQIVSSFNGLAGFVFTRDSDFIGDEKAGFKLDAAYSYDEALETQRISENFGRYLARLKAGSHCMHFTEISVPELLENSRYEGETGNLLVCPIVIDEHLQGAVCIFRIGGAKFSEDDSSGLEMIVNELSMLIYVDHQRRLAVSFAERKKLVKDLHDTVTQQIYGLLYQVEITQAQLEINRTEDLPNSLNKIGSIARQALREMRLFLHELQPVDLKNEGLVSALHRRLTAVEGRANIHPRFISPELLEISLQQELNLYQIAREALNNVLRHSGAKNVTVHLTEQRGNVCLEIRDDGQGFEKSALKNSAGMGVKNIKEWAAQIRAKITIQSRPGNGTQIKVVLPKTNTINQ